MGIIDDLLHRRIVLEVRGDESYTLHISREGMRLEKGRDPWAQAVMRTTLEEWRRVFQGEGTFCAIFRMEPEPCRDPVRLHQLAVV
ncbi:MAG: hypothetical protein H5T72_10795 [Actinobacteria bacterium]|nr:hypothetical protein [Actinomycetota bacterium]